MNSTCNDSQQVSDRQSEYNDELFIRLTQDGDSVVGAFVGDPYAREVHWNIEGYDDCTGKDCSYCRVGERPKMRVSINFFVPDENDMKIIEGGVLWFKSLVKAKEKYGLDKWFFEIERHGEARDPKTRYTIMPEMKISTEQLQHIQSFELHDLEKIISGYLHDESLDSEVIKAMSERLKRLPKSYVHVFLRQLGVSRVKDIPTSYKTAAWQLLGGLEAWAKRRAEQQLPDEIDPFIN